MYLTYYFFTVVAILFSEGSSKPAAPIGPYICLDRMFCSGSNGIRFACLTMFVSCCEKPDGSFALVDSPRGTKCCNGSGNVYIIRKQTCNNGVITWKPAVINETRKTLDQIMGLKAGGTVLAVTVSKAKQTTGTHLYFKVIQSKQLSSGKRRQLRVVNSDLKILEIPRNNFYPLLPGQIQVNRRYIVITKSKVRSNRLKLRNSKFVMIPAEKDDVFSMLFDLGP